MTAKCSPLTHSVAAPYDDQVGADLYCVADPLRGLLALRYVVPEELVDARVGEPRTQLVEPAAE
jgi:hypothetical protein